MINSLFGTDGIRGLANKYPIDPITIGKLGMAIGNIGNRVLLGKDTRISGYMLESALTSGLISAGSNVILIGPIPTSAISMLTRSLNADIGIMISASHNPHHDNGIKIFNQSGEKFSTKESKSIEFQLTQDLNHKLTDIKHLGKAIRLNDAHSRYIKFVKNTFPSSHNLDGKKIVLDCANGAAYKVAPKILRDLGAEVITLNVNPNGFNINEDCGALYPSLIAEATSKHKADLGISLDGDADRVILCDENSHIINGEQILATIVKTRLKNKNSKNRNLVSNIMASISFEKYLKGIGINLLRSDVGDQHILNSMKKSNCDIGGEPSGHIILSEYNTTSDGMIVALQILASMCIENKKASVLCNDFKAQPAVLKNITNYNINLQNAKIKKFITNAEEMLGKSGRLLIRKSGTEKLIRILAEGQDIIKVNNTINNAVKVLSKMSQEN